MGRNKLLELIDGKPMVACVAETALECGVVCPVIVVAGFEANRVADALHGLDVTIVNNLDFEQGLSTSLCIGLEALPPDCDGALILLGDMPLDRIERHHGTDSAGERPERYLHSGYQGKMGNPVLWGAAYFPEMMQLTGDFGAKQLLG